MFSADVTDRLAAGQCARSHHDSYAQRVREVGSASHRAPEVGRGDGSGSRFLAFRGTSAARSSVDRDTRLRIVLPVAQAARLWQLLGDHLTDEEKSTRAAF